VSRAFLVAKNSGGYRLVIDLRVINSCFEPPKVSFESLAELKACPETVKFGISIDVADAYHHLKLDDSIGKYF
jgi:hypothetical protein